MDCIQDAEQASVQGAVPIEREVLRRGRPDMEITGISGGFNSHRLSIAARIDSRLDQVLDRYGAGPLHEPVCHALRGGKRFRGFLVIEGSRLYGVEMRQAEFAAAAVECMHAYSLVHDDLPCMDDDDLRRGRPTVHKKWNEAVAVLAGDALQTLSFEVLSDPACIPDPSIRSSLVNRLARRAGGRGMAAGQALDIAAENRGTEIGLDGLNSLHWHKTGDLISWSTEAGAILANQDHTALRAYARALGLGYQIADDLLDETGIASVTGKRVGKDAIAGKATYVSLLGVEGARRRAGEQLDLAIAALEDFGDDASLLRQAAVFAIRRTY